MRAYVNESVRKGVFVEFNWWLQNPFPSPSCLGESHIGLDLDTEYIMGNVVQVERSFDPDEQVSYND